MCSANKYCYSEFRRYESTTTGSPRSTKVSPAWKIVAGVALASGGGVVGAALAFHYSTDVRTWWMTNFPYLAPYLGTLGESLTGSKKPPILGKKPNSASRDPTKPSSVDEPLNLGLSTQKAPLKDADLSLRKPVKPLVEGKESVASVSSVDQTGISAVDLAIARTVEKEVKQSANSIEPKSDAPQNTVGKPPKPGVRGKAESPTAAVSALDQVGVSSVDLDISSAVEKEAEPAATAKMPEITEKLAEKGKDAESHEIKGVDTSLTEKEVEALVDQTAMEAIVYDAVEKLKVTGQEAVEAQEKAAKAIQEHVEQLKSALAQSLESGTLKDLSDLVLNSQKAATDSVIAAKIAQVKVNEEVEKVHSIIKEAEAAGAKGAGTTATEEAARVSYSVQKAALDMQQAKVEAAVLEEHQKDLAKSKDMFRKELLDIIPGALKEEALEGVEERDVRSESVLLAYARKRLDQLTQELLSYQTEEQKRLENSLKIQREEDAKVTELKLKQEAERMASEFETTAKKKEAELSAAHEVSLRQQLRRQAAAYSDHLAEVLRVQATELENRYKDDLQQKLAVEKEAFKVQLAGALAQLRGVVSVIEGRADVEKQNKRAQNLWTACQSLTTAIDKGATQPKPLLPQLTAIHDAAAEDPLVSQVLNSLSEEVVLRGVLNEENVTRRFYKIRRWCRRVAMIGENGASPWTHVLSYIQSFLIFDSFDPVKQGELVDLDNLDTFDLLARAEYYLRRGDLELATRLVNQLRGEPKNVARDWLLEARLLLETRQAVNLLTAYAAVLGTAGLID